jgi:hypothetical protein
MGRVASSCADTHRAVLRNQAATRLAIQMLRTAPAFIGEDWPSAAMTPAGLTLSAHSERGHGRRSQCGGPNCPNSAARASEPPLLLSCLPVLAVMLDSYVVSLSGADARSSHAFEHDQSR